MDSLPIWVSLVLPLPRSSKRVTSNAPSMASCSKPSCSGSTLFPCASAKYMEETIFSCGTISWYSTVFQNSWPSGDFMQKRDFPPTRKSIWQTGAVKPLGPHHCFTYFGSVHAFQTSSRGASNTLVITIRSTSFTVFCVISSLLFLHFLYNCIQLVEALFPEPAIRSRPVADRLDRLRPKRAHALPSTLCLDHHPRPHQVSNVFRNHLLRQSKWFRQPVHRGRPVRKPLNHRPPGRIGQSRESHIERIHNQMVVNIRWLSTAKFAVLDHGSPTRPKRPARASAQSQAGERTSDH